MPRHIDVGRVIAVNKKEGSFTVLWPQAEEVMPFDDPDIEAEETQLTEEDQMRTTRYSSRRTGLTIRCSCSTRSSRC